MDAINYSANMVDKDVAFMINKIKLCEKMGWTPSQYDKEPWSSLRKFHNYYSAVDAKKKRMNSMG